MGDGSSVLAGVAPLTGEAKPLRFGSASIRSNIAGLARLE